MYMPRSFEEKRTDVLHAMIDAHPLGALVRSGEHGLEADHIPFEIAPAAPDAPLGVLRAHVARANPVWREAGVQAMVLFQGPSAYIPPEFYEEKALTGKVVPTWDYAVVHAHGRLRAIDNPAWLLDLLGRLTDRHERARATPWSVKDAPASYIDKLLKAVVGIEIVIERLEGKWKMSQNHSVEDQRRVAAGLALEPQAATLAELMKQQLPR